MTMRYVFTAKIKDHVDFFEHELTIDTTDYNDALAQATTMYYFLFGVERTQFDSITLLKADNI